MSAPTEEDDRDSKIDGDCHASVRYFIAMTGNSIARKILLYLIAKLIR